MDTLIRDFLGSARLVVREVYPYVRAAALAESRSCSHKADGSLVTETDRAVEEAFFAQFRASIPSVCLLGEEAVIASEVSDSRNVERYYGQFLNAPYHVIIDPIDGTKNFVEGREEFCIAASLTRNVGQGIWPVVSLVAIPREAIMYWCDQVAVYREEIESGRVSRVERASTTALTVSVSSKDRGWLATNKYILQCPWISSGSSVHDFMGTLLGRLAGSIIGSQRLWDLAAPLAFADKLGVVLRDLQTGEQVECLGAQDLSPDIEQRPWGLTRPMILLPRSEGISAIVVKGEGAIVS